MTRNVAYLIVPSGISAQIDGRSYSVPTDHPNYQRIKDALTTGATHLLDGLMDIRATVRNFISSNRRFKLVNDQLQLDGRSFSFAVTEKILSLINAGMNAEPLFNFLAKVRLNPSLAAQDELLLFCVANKFMIHTDGDIIAYKSVNDSYRDIHSDTFSNRIGDVCTMERNAVDDNRNVTCSSGLHFATFEYASTWAGSACRHLMIIKVNPRDVVSIPSDYSNQKARTCRYEVIAESKDFSPIPFREVYEDEDIDNDYACDCEYCTDGNHDEDYYSLGYDAGADYIRVGVICSDARACGEYVASDRGFIGADADEFVDGFVDGINDNR